MLKRIFTSLPKSYLALATPFRTFVQIPSDLTSEVSHNYQPVLDLYAKRIRKIGLDKTVLEKNKVVVPALRVRQVDDTLEKLRNARECAVVINGRDEFEDVDLVFEIRQMTLLKNRKNCYTQPFYVKVNDELIKCTLEDVKRHPKHDWIVGAKLNRFIPGRPNLLYLPLMMSPRFENKYMNKGSEHISKYRGLWVYVYNEDFPLYLEFCPTTATPRRGYRLGEFINTLPDGLEPHPRYKHELNNFMVRLGETRDILLEKELEYRELQRKIKAGIDTEAEDLAKLQSQMDQEAEEMLTEEAKAAREARKIKQEERRAIHKKKKPKTLKKLVAAMNYTVKEGGAVSIGEKQTKGGKDHKEG